MTAVGHWKQDQLCQKTKYLSFMCQTEQLQEFSLIFIAWMACGLIAIPQIRCLGLYGFDKENTTALTAD